MTRDDPNLPPHGHVPESINSLALCNWCRTLTSRAELSQLGARCRRCYEAYCKEPQAWQQKGKK